MSPRRVFRPRPPGELGDGFARIRTRLGLPDGFPSGVLADAARAARRDPFDSTDHTDRLDIEFLTIDPPESVDLDQAFQAERDGDGFRARYAITDVGWFISPGGPIDVESRHRGQTLYSPDLRTTLYPPALEQSASMVPGLVRPAILWTFDLDEHGATRTVAVHRALVRSARRLTYDEAQRAIDSGGADESLRVLRELGIRLQERERARGGVSLAVPAQEVARDDGSYRLVFRCPLPVEEWNAQISLLTGMSAAALMLGSGAGLVRTLPPVPDAVLAELRLTARALEVTWPEGTGYAEFLRSLDGGRPEHAALMAHATRLFRGGGYEVVRGESPKPRGRGDLWHHAIAAPYAHVTAPLRRVADRFANEIVLAIAAGRAPPPWAMEALPELPQVMADADRRADELERRSLDYVEAAVLESRVGETFDALVIEAFDRGVIIQLREPAVRAYCKGRGLALGESLRVRLVEANPRRGIVEFVPA
jgi:exoribonuclease R